MDKENRTAHYLNAFHPEKVVLKFEFGFFCVDILRNGLRQRCRIQDEVQRQQKQLCTPCQLSFG